MCDERTEQETQDYLRKRGVSRRGFGALMGAAGMAAFTARPAHAAEVVESDVMIETPDGVCDAYFVHPVEGATAAVLVWPDIFGLRPAFRGMGKRLAEAGYAVLTVNPYYRGATAPVPGYDAAFGAPEFQDNVMPLAQALNPETQVTDATAFIAWLDAQDAVDTSRQIGTTGYCMGGPFVMRTAAAIPGRVGAGATFHGGGLATDAPDSPHLLIPQMEASFLIAIAENDDESDPQAKETLRETFAANGVNAEVEVYEGTMHGWCPTDSRVYHEEQAEHAWARLLALFETALA